MRTFYLENEYGQKYELNNISTGFLQNPTGLGYSIETSYTKLGISWHRNTFKDTQATISAEIVFGTSSPYEACQDFFSFVRASKSLVIHRTTAAGEFLRDVDLVSCDVSEIGEGNLLTIPVSFISKSLWYSTDVNRIEIQHVTGDITRYAYRFPSIFDPFTDGYVTIENNGSVDSGFQMEFYGPVANPSCDVKADGETVGTIDIIGSVAAGSKIIYSSVDGDIYVFSGTDEAIDNFKSTGDTTGLTNLVPSLSISNVNFFKIPVGTSQVHVTADSSLTAPVVITTYKYFRAV